MKGDGEVIGHLHEPVDTSFSCGVSKQARKAEVTLGTHEGDRAP